MSLGWITARGEGETSIRGTESFNIRALFTGHLWSLQSERRKKVGNKRLSGGFSSKTPCIEAVEEVKGGEKGGLDRWDASALVNGADGGGKMGRRGENVQRDTFLNWSWRRRKWTEKAVFMTVL